MNWKYKPEQNWNKHFYKYQTNETNYNSVWETSSCKYTYIQKSVMVITLISCHYFTESQYSSKRNPVADIRFLGWITHHTASISVLTKTCLWHFNVRIWQALHVLFILCYICFRYPDTTVKITLCYFRNQTKYNNFNEKQPKSFTIQGVVIHKNLGQIPKKKTLGILILIVKTYKSSVKICVWLQNNHHPL